MTCKHCGGFIVKRLIGWAHVWPTHRSHIAKPARK